MANLFKKNNSPVTTDDEGNTKLMTDSETMAPPAEEPAKEKVVKPAMTTERLGELQKVWDDLKAEAKALNPVPAELTVKITKARKAVRAAKKALGIFIPVADRPKAEKPVKEPKTPKTEETAEPELKAGPIL